LILDHDEMDFAPMLKHA